MSRRITPGPGVRKTERFRQVDVQRFSNFDRDARNHIIGRNQAVAEVLCFLSLMRNAGLVPGDAVPTAEGARYQSLGGSRSLGTEGAHCLPCQLAILGPPTPLESMLPNRDARGHIRILFGQTTHLPRAFNVADRAAEAAEGGGLIGAFLAAGRAVIQRPRMGQQPEVRRVPGIGADFGYDEFRPMWPISRSAVIEAYERRWKPAALLAYERARAEVQATGKHLSSADDPASIVAVLIGYMRHHDESPTKLLDRQMDETERLFNRATLPPGIS